MGVHIMVKPIVAAFAAHSVSSCALLRVFDAFCAAWMAISCCIGWDIGGTLSAFDAAFLLGIPTGQRAWSDVGIHLVLRLTIVWNATADLPCFMKQDRWAAMKPWAWQHDSREYVQLLGFIRWLMWNLVGFWDGGVLIACSLAQWNRDRLWSLPSSRRRREGNNSYTGWRKFFPLYGPRGVVKNLK